MAAASDPVVWNYAATSGFLIVSKDTDFQQRAILLGWPPKIVWMRLGNCSTQEVVEHLRDHLAVIMAFEVDLSASFLALS